MGHGIEKHDDVVLHTTRAWHGLGTIVSDDMTCEQAYESHIDWEPHSQPVFVRDALGTLHELEDTKANVRWIDTPEGPTPIKLGMVTDNYDLCLNRVLAQFGDDIADSGEAVVETCGTLNNGRHIWFLMRGEAFEIGGDKQYKYVLLSNSHTGGGSVQITPTFIRVVCRNTLQAVIGSLEAQGSVREFSRSAITLPHTGSIQDRLAATKQALAKFNSDTERSREYMHQLAEVKIDEDEALAFFAGQYSASFQSGSEDVSKKVADQRFARQAVAAQEFLKRFRYESGQFGGMSAWLALNAWTGYLQNDRNPAADGEDRARACLFNTGARRTAGAFADALNLWTSA